ncbi:MAG: DUF4157 domain-containing protein [Cohaesibacteraceae bacterium]|nr:DUF4157 domain-containing protein [Cohaesibacteraceae bacterium]MBL4875087.1 DUF4157 domain-containing protein [Cohaesibacteraceae bacterium]
MNRIVVSAVLVFLFSIQPSLSGGFIGNFIEKACGNCGLGKKLDGLHKAIGSPMDIPGRIARESVVETAGPLLGEAIRHSRDNARAAGTKPIPSQMFQKLVLFYPRSLLLSIQFRVGQGHELSVQANSFRFGDATAVALIDTIIFRSENDVRNDVLWAHEIKHIDQFQRWGLSNFGKRYVRNHSAVEKEAETTAQQYSNLRNASVRKQNNSRTNQKISAGFDWLYIGRFKNGWRNRNFDWRGSKMEWPKPGTFITAVNNVNVREDHIRYIPQTGKWKNANKTGAIESGQTVKIVDVIDVTLGGGYIWAKIRNSNRR